MTGIIDGIRQGAAAAVSVLAADISDFTSAVQAVVDDPEKRQLLTATINGSATWQKVAYPSAFPAGSQLTIMGTAQDDNGSHFFIRVRAVTRQAFQFIAVNFNGDIHTGAGVVMDDSFGSGIAYNESTGVATLKAGKVYRLFATFAFFSIESADTVAIDWVKASDNVPLRANHETRLRPANANSNGSNGNTIEVIYAPAVDTDVKLRCTEYTHATDAVTMYGERSMAIVIEIR